MLGSLVVSAMALLVAVLGCAWLKPVGVRERQSIINERRSRREPSLAAHDDPGV
jgi:hypothetical protein